MVGGPDDLVRRYLADPIDPACRTGTLLPVEVSCQKGRRVRVEWICGTNKGAKVTITESARRRGAVIPATFHVQKDLTLVRGPLVHHLPGGDDVHIASHTFTIGIGKSVGDRHQEGVQVDPHLDGCLFVQKFGGLLETTPDWLE